MALPFLQALLVGTHDLILAKTPRDFEARRFRGPPKRALFSWVSQVDWKSMEDTSISTRARSSDRVRPEGFGGFWVYGIVIIYTYYIV